MGKKLSLPCAPGCWLRTPVCASLVRIWPQDWCHCLDFPECSPGCWSDVAGCWSCAPACWTPALGRCCDAPGYYSGALAAALVLPTRDLMLLA